jgi:hypothetical protein
MPPPDVVQFRIHGVGGATPEGLLGLAAGTETRRVAGDEQAGFYVRPEDPHVQGYVWWKLTSGFKAAFWIVLLPFTLFNVGNWMFPRERGGWRPARSICRFLMFLVGLSLTLTYLLWEFDLIVQQVFYQWWRFGESPAPSNPCGCIISVGSGQPPQLPGWLRGPLPPYLEPPWVFRTVLGILALIALGFAVLYVAKVSRQRFEGYTGPRSDVEPKSEPPPAVLGFPLRAPEGLGDRFFWSHSKDSQRQLWIHLVAGTALFVALVIWTLPQAHAHADNLNLGPWFEWLVGAQLALLVLLLLTYVLGWGRAGLGTRFKVAPPIVVAIASVALTTGFFAGFTFWLAHRLKLGQQDVLEVPQFGAFGLAALALAISVVVLLIVEIPVGRRQELQRLRESHEIPINDAPPGHEQNGVTESTLKNVALARSLSATLEKVDWLFTPASLVYLAFALPFGLPGVLLHHSVPSWLHGLPTFGTRILTLAVGATAPALLFRSFRPNANSKVKILWDATTFWPRRFHPFAVRPYGERAVPEIEGRLYHLVVGQKKRVVIAAHSQGSVLMYCALAQLAAWREEEPGGGPAPPDVTGRIAMVTFGSPLYRMHARYFPGYFVYPDDFVKVRAQLAFADRPADAWSNFYRLTDYVGQAVFEPMGQPDSDHKLPDPPTTPAQGDIPTNLPAPVQPDARPPIFTKLSIHSFYNNTDEMRSWIDDHIEPLLQGLT